MLHDTSLTMMQRLQQAAGNDYLFYTTGHTQRDKFDGLVHKFNLQYETGISRQSKTRRKRSGMATSCLHALHTHWLPHSNEEKQIWFVLMATKGMGRIHIREQLQDLRQRDYRLTTPDGRYELVHDGVSWSWQMTKPYVQKYRERIHQIAALPTPRRRQIEMDGIVRDLAIERLQDQLYAEPGFRLIRRQVGQIVKYLRAEWKRLRPAAGPQLRQISYLPYVRFRPNKQADHD